MPGRPKTSTPLTRAVVAEIVDECFGGSQLKLAKAAMLTPATVSRLLKDEEEDADEDERRGRSASPDQVGLIVAAVPKHWGLKLLEAFLSDVAAATKAQGFTVRVSKR